AATVLVRGPLCADAGLSPGQPVLDATARRRRRNTTPAELYAGPELTRDRAQARASRGRPFPGVGARSFHGAVSHVRTEEAPRRRARGPDYARNLVACARPARTRRRIRHASVRDPRTDAAGQLRPLSAPGRPPGAHPLPRQGEPLDG